MDQVLNKKKIQQKFTKVRIAEKRTDVILCLMKGHNRGASVDNIKGFS